MRIGEVIGTVTLVRWHPSLEGGSFRLAVPLSLAELRGESAPAADPMVVYDDLGAAPGNRIGITEGREAANAFHPREKPLDAYNAAILDRVDV